VTLKFFELVLTLARSWPMIAINDCSYRAAHRGHIADARIWRLNASAAALARPRIRDLTGEDERLGKPASHAGHVTGDVQAVGRGDNSAGGVSGEADFWAVAVV
jgi:hypothetical protein